MKIKELIIAAEKLQIDPGFYCLSGKDAVHNTYYYGIARNKGKWEIYYCDWHGPDVRAVYDTEEAACEAFYRILKDEEDRLRKMNKIPMQWRITAVRISSRSSADVYFGEKTVRIPGEMMVDHFLAVPYDMFWLAEEDRDIWPWKLPQERRMNTLSEAERQSVMTAVNEYYRHRKDPVIFLTKELEDRSLELAEMIRNKQISGPMWIARRKAAALLKKEFPGLPDKFYRYQIIDSLTGARW